MEEQFLEIENVRFMLDSIKILLECGETKHALQLLEAYRAKLNCAESDFDSDCEK
ncbi:MAG: hypothetical protein LUF89_07460 [Ruminococcus sp.]|nr:hypothetical protein [Ruminococcus sp.]